MSLEAQEEIRELTIDLDVGAAIPGSEACMVACSVFAPATPPARPIIVLAQHGGGYDRRYWDMRPAGRDDYSQARHFARNGVVFCAIDCVGCGESCRPADADAITMEVAADAAQLALEQVRVRLARGVSGVAPLADPILIGVGQSMGGSTTVVQQARHSGFEAIALLGASDAAGKLLTFDRDSLARWAEMTVAQRRDVVRAVLEDRIGVLPEYAELSHAAFSEGFFGPQPDAQLLAYDEEHLCSALPRGLMLDTGTPMLLDAYVTAVECPVFLGFGEHEAQGREAWSQPARYTASRDITLSVFPDMAHMHNFAQSRRQLWDRLLSWMDGVTATL